MSTKIDKIRARANEPQAVFLCTCPKCGNKFRVGLSRSAMKQFIKNIDREWRKRNKA